MIIQEEFLHEEIQGFKFGSAPFGKPTMFSHIYFIDGLLIDTGHRNVRKEVLEKIKQLDVKQIFLTHHHEDHTGNAQILKQHFNCPVYGSEKCAEIMKSPPPISFAQQLTWGKRAAFHEIEPISGTISTPNFQFQIISVPGHSADMVVLYEPNRKWLFSADLYVNYYIAYFMKAESLSQQIHSIKKVLELDFDILLCGHNPQFKDGKELFTKKLQFFEDFYTKAKGHYQKGLNASGILRAMNLKERWGIRLLSHGHLSRVNMIKAVIRDVESE